MQKARAASETVAVWSPFLAVAGLAVNVGVGAVASVDGVQRLGAVVALEALAMPLSSFGQDFFGSEHYPAAARTSLSRLCLDGSSIDDSSLGCLVATRSDYSKADR